MGDMQGALDELQAAAGVLGHRNPKVWEIYVKIGDLLKAAGDYTQALRAYDAALDVSPNQVSAFTQRGILNQEFDAYEKAEKDFESAVQLDPTNPQAWSGLGIAWMYLEHALPDGKPKGYDSYDEGSIFALRRVMSLQPKDMVTLSNLVMAENRVCDWSYKKEHEKAMKQALRERASRKENFAPPFHAFEFGYSPKELLVNSKYLSKRISESVQHRRKLVPPNPAAANLTSSHKLRIGYVNGAGFRNSTTTARCLQSMFKHHSKTVEIFCYALSSDDGSRERSSIQTSCDGGWVEGSRLTDDELAAQVSKDEIHILVDTTGYTMKQRTEIFALSRAPIVLSFHGFPGTMAAKFVHYLSSDRLTSPPEYQSYYTEKLALVPYSYLINDHKQSRQEVTSTTEQITRTELGFNEDDIILASFNQLYKIEPKIFKVWMRIMREVPSTKLWLLNFSKAASKYLRKEAAAAGVAKDRLVFHSKFPKDIELLAKSHADLFLDTPLFNAHTTGGDVLWAAIPMLSLPGENFAQRVASGLIRSVRMINMSLVRDLDDYAEVVIRMCRRRRVLHDLKQQLRQERQRLPLFATNLLTSHVEISMKMMWEVHASGTKPRHVVVADSS
uniref:protein O-GlcNAc transferase n=1 Tax=Hanusia phi TaxID=3032 RepID=A0A7S0H957_9CRYP